MLLKLVSILDLSTPYWSCFWAACVVAFFGFLRKSNLFVHKDHSHYLQRKHVRLLESGQVVLVLSSSKTIQYKQKQIYLPLPSIKNHVLCPVSALKRCFVLNPVQGSEEPVFCYSTGNSVEPMRYAEFVKTLRRKF